MRIGRWLILVAGPLTVGVSIALSNPVTAGASNGLSEQMEAVTGRAWYQCATGYNQNTFAPNPQTNKCFYTPNYQNADTGWWWCSQQGVQGFDCGNPWAQSGYTVANAWFDYYHNWITNTQDGIGLYPSYYCCGGSPVADYYKVFGP